MEHFLFLTPFSTAPPLTAPPPVARSTAKPSHPLPELLGEGARGGVGHPQRLGLFQASEQVLRSPAPLGQAHHEGNDMALAEPQKGMELARYPTL